MTKRPRLSDDVALVAKVRLKDAPYYRERVADYVAIAARAKVEADPRAGLELLKTLVQFRRPNTIKSNWQTFAGFDDATVAAIFREQCAKTQPEMEFRTVSLNQ